MCARKRNEREGKRMKVNYKTPYVFVSIIHPL